MSNADLFERARRVLVGGVNSPVRTFAGAETPPLVLVSGKGGTVRDADGKEYVDLVGAWGPAILGHAHPAVVEAVARAARDGLALGATHPLEIDLAERVCATFPAVERVRFVTSGTEAVMSALRLARAATGRERIVKFEGCYHGHSDGLLAQAGSGLATLGQPSSPGVPTAFAEGTVTLPYNDADRLAAFMEKEGTSVAAVIVEPVAGNMGVIPPMPGFLERLRASTEAFGALLIFDEVITGYRLGPGGAQVRFGIRPDLVTLGKVLGGGLPVGAYGGPASLMERMAPVGPVYQAGTLAGNPVVMAAGLATLDRLDAGAFDRLESSTATLAERLRETLESLRIPGTVPHMGSMIGLFFRGTPPRNFTEAKESNAARFRQAYAVMLKEGVLPPPSPFETWFWSLAHGEEEADRVAGGLRKALERELADEGGGP